jgi:hypothetical protein
VPWHGRRRVSESTRDPHAKNSPWRVRPRRPSTTVTRGDLVGGTIVVCWAAVLAAIGLTERGAAAPDGAAPDRRRVESLTPAAGVGLPADHATYDVRRGAEVVGRVDADQGRFRDDAAARGAVAPGAVYWLKRVLRLDLARLKIPGELPPALGVSSTLEAQLADDLSLASFRFEAAGPDGPLASAHGTLTGSVARLTLTFGASTEDVSVPLTSPPLLEEAALPLLAHRGDLARLGARFSLAVLDPQTGRPDTVLLEVAGPEVVALADGGVMSAIKVVREPGSAAARAVWVDPHGRIVREELPLGLVSVRAALPDPIGPPGPSGPPPSVPPGPPAGDAPASAPSRALPAPSPPVRPPAP